MSLRQAVAASSALVVILGCALAGCGGQPATPTPMIIVPSDNGIAALPADEILARAKTMLTQANSVHIQGERTVNGIAMTVDLRFNGDDVTGILRSPQLLLTVVRVGSDLYLKAPEAVWAGLLGLDPTDSRLVYVQSDYGQVKTTRPTVAQLTRGLTVSDMIWPHGGVSKGAATSSGGQPAIGLIDNADQTVLFIATTGDPFPLRIEDATGRTVVEFSEFGTIFRITPPAIYVDLATILR